MGKLPDGIFGGFTGKVGKLVGYNYGGEDMIRKRPKKRPEGSGTERQLAQREKFGLVMRFLTPIQEVVGEYFGKRNGTKSRFNLGVSYNLTHAVIDNPGGGFALDFAEVLISKGDLRPMENGQLEAMPDQVVDLTWTDNSGQGAATAEDLVVVVAYAPELDFFQIFNPATTRGEARTSLELLRNFSGEEVHIWTTMASEERKTASVSTYLGTVTVN